MIKNIFSFILVIALLIAVFRIAGIQVDVSGLLQLVWSFISFVIDFIAQVLTNIFNAILNA